MSEEQTGFKVTDRRLFNADGSPRELSPEEKQEAAAAKAASASTAPIATDPQRPSQAPVDGPASATSESRLPGDAEAEFDAEEADLSDSRDPASFVNFLMSIASNAASALGMMEHPVTHQRDVDLELAKHWIDVVGMLQHKTRGNLNSQESQIVEGLLSDLRMQYVSLANSKQAKAAPSYTGRDITGGK